MKRTFFLVVLIFVLGVRVCLGGVPETISYQGLLTNASGLPLNGNYNLTFSLYNLESGGAPVWTETHTSVSVANGIFNVILGGASPPSPLLLPFHEQYWLGIRVNSGNELAPRAKLTSAPYSLNARTVADNAITTFKLADNAVTTAKIQPNILSSVDGVSNDGGNIDLIPGSNITITPDDGANTITISATVDAWKLTGNGGTNPATNFLGTSDNKALELRVNNLRSFRLEPHSISPNIIGGFSGNSVTSGIYGGTISGGGSNGFINQVTKNYGTISGGNQNAASGEMSTVSGGSGNTAQGNSSTIAGGTNNAAIVNYASVGGGYSNEAQGIYSAISGGWDNTITTSANYAAIGGGRYNSAGYEYVTVGGGFSNSANANYATISGGGRSSPGDPSTGNRVTDDYGSIGGGGNNQAGNVDGDILNSTYATVGGGKGNKAIGPSTTVAGGESNEAIKTWSAVGGGYGNKALQLGTVVAGGELNEANGGFATVSGGQENKATRDYGNEASGYRAIVPGGFMNKAKGLCSFAAGLYAIADGDGSFVWGDHNANELHAWNPNEFVCRATGGFWFITKIDSNGAPIEGMQLPAGKSVWVPLGSTTSGVSEASQEQANHVQALEAENADLKQRIERLEERLAILESLILPNLQGEQEEGK